MDQTVAELMVRTIKQTLHEARRCFDDGIGNPGSIINKLQRFKVTLTAVSFQDSEYQQQLVNALHEVAVELENHAPTIESESEQSETETDEEIESDSEEALPHLTLSKMYTGV